MQRPWGRLSLALELISCSGPAWSCLLSRIWGLLLVLGVSTLTLLIRPGMSLDRQISASEIAAAPTPTPVTCRAESVMNDPEPTGRSKRARGVWQLPDLMRADKADGHRGRKVESVMAWV